MQLKWSRGLPGGTDSESQHQLSWCSLQQVTGCEAHHLKNILSIWSVLTTIVNYLPLFRERSSDLQGKAWDFTLQCKSSFSKQGWIVLKAGWNIILEAGLNIILEAGLNSSLQVVPLEAEKGRNLHVVFQTCLFKRRFCTGHGRDLVRTPHHYGGSWQIALKRGLLWKNRF